MPNNKSVIVENIKEYRKKKGTSQDMLSKKSDITHNTIIQIESGAIFTLRVEVLKQIANTLSVGIGDLMK